MFICLQHGYATGTVNYENRKRDITIESSNEVAINLMRHINTSLFVQNKELILEAGFDENSFEDVNTIIHEIMHGFHGVAVFESSAFEEGMTVAATDAVM